MARNAPHHEESDSTSITSMALSLRAKRIARALVSKLVEHIEHADSGAHMGAVVDEA